MRANLPEIKELLMKAWVLALLEREGKLDVSKEVSRKYSNSQSEKAQKQRSYVVCRGGDKTHILDFVRKLVEKPEYHNYTARELWSHFISELYDVGADPRAIA